MSESTTFNLGVFRRICEWAMRHGVTQVEIGDHIGRSQGVVNRWLKKEDKLPMNPEDLAHGLNMLIDEVNKRIRGRNKSAGTSEKEQPLIKPTIFSSSCPVDEIPESFRPVQDTGSDSPISEQLRLFGFGKRTTAINTLVRWQKQIKATEARIVCFTGHTLGDALIKLLSTEVKHLTVYMCTKEMARRLQSTRQEDLLDSWWGEDTEDLKRRIKTGRITIRYYDCPPSFAGIALDEKIYLINHYLWMPTLHWLEEKEPKAYQQYWDEMKFERRPSVDDYTVNGVDVSSILAIKGYDGPAGRAFQAVSQSFELVWKTLERDWDRPPAAGDQRYKPFEEMELLQKCMLTGEEGMMRKSRTEQNKPDAPR